MRVVHLAAFGGPYAGSFIPMLRATMRAIRARGWRGEVVFTAIARDRAWLPELAAEDVPVRFAPPGSRRQVSDWLRQLLAEDDGPTALSTHYTQFDVPAVLAARGRPATAVFWHIRSAARPELAARLRNLVKYPLLGRRVDAILCVSPQIARSIKRRLAPRGKILVFPNVIDADRFPVATPDEKAAARAALGLPARGRVLLHFGWDWPLKGGDLFLRAAKLLRDSESEVAGGAGSEDIMAVTVWGGPPARSLASSLGLGDAVRVVDPAERVQTLYAAADLFVAASRDEGGFPPNAVAEALCSGVPVVASDIPAHRVVGERFAACRLAKLEPPALAEAIGAVLSRDRDTIAAETAAARAWVSEARNPSAWAARLTEVYERVLPTG